MGFFDSLVDGIGSGVHWVQSNSGTIAQAIGTIGSVAGLLAGASAETGTGVNTEGDADLYTTFEQADTVLRNKNKAKISEFSMPHHDSSVKERTISGVWSMPTSTSSDEQPSLQMYQDLVRILAQFDLPTHTKAVDGKSSMDIAYKLAQELFADPPSKGPALNSPNELIQSISITLPIGENMTLACVHSHYAIPMGNAGQSISWHSALTFALTTNKQGLFELAEQRKSSTLPVESTGAKSKTLQWATTLKVCWTTIHTVQMYAPALITEFKTAYPGYTIFYSDYRTTTQIIKVHAPLSGGPGPVCAAVTTVCVKVVNGGNASINTFASNQPVPQVEVINSCVF